MVAFLEIYFSPSIFSNDEQMITEKVSQRCDQKGCTNKEHKVRPGILQNEPGVQSEELR